MNESIRFGRIAGISVGANWSLLLIVWLIVASLAGAQLPHAAPGYTTAAYVVAALVITALFYAGLLAHELAHSLVARRHRIDVDGIVLWMLGGASRLKSDAVSASSELRIALAGPVTSVAVGLGFFGLSRVAAAAHPGSLLAGSLGWLGWMNGILAAFNLLPAFPLDGGRVLRALLWRHGGDKERATITAAHVGGVFGYGLAGLGAVGFLAGRGWISGLWLAIVGWFVASAARAEVHTSAARAELAGLRVRDAMTPEPVTVPVWASLDSLMHEGVQARRLTTFPVVAVDGSFAGLVTLDRMRRVPTERWPFITAVAVALPPERCVTCAPDDEVALVGQDLDTSHDRRAVVLDGGRVVGIVSPGDLRRAAAHRTVTALSA